MRTLLLLAFLIFFLILFSTGVFALYTELRPNEEGYILEWSCGVNHYAALSDNNGWFIETTKIPEIPTVDAYDAVGVQNVSGYSIASVRLRWKCFASGGGSAEKINTFLRVSGTNYADLSGQSVSRTAYTNYTGTNRTTSPATGQAWTIDEVNGLQAVVQANAMSNDETIYCIEAYVLIWYSTGIQAPTYSLNSTNSTQAGKPIEFRLKWQDDVGLSKAITSLWNGSSWVNASNWCSLSGTSSWCNQTLTVNSTPQQLWWKQYANDTSNNWNTSINFSLIASNRWLEVNLTSPNSIYQNPSNPLEVFQNDIFNVNATVKCKTQPSGLSCGEILGTVRDNHAEEIVTQTFVGSSDGEDDWNIYYDSLFNYHYKFNPGLINGIYLSYSFDVEDIDRSMVRFNLSSIPSGAKIVNAILNLTTTESIGQDRITTNGINISLWNVSQEPYTETQACDHEITIYDCASPNVQEAHEGVLEGVSIILDSLAAINPNQIESINVKNLVSYWMENHTTGTNSYIGFFMKAEDESEPVDELDKRAYYADYEDISYTEPRLIVTYTIPATNPNPTTLISTSVDTPFYIQYGSGPNNKSCGELKDGGTTCQLNWSINATGQEGTNWLIDVNFSSNLSTSLNNNSADAYIRIPYKVILKDYIESPCSTSFVTDNDYCIPTFNPKENSSINITFHYTNSTSSSSLIDQTLRLKYAQSKNPKTSQANLDVPYRTNCQVGDNVVLKSVYFNKCTGFSDCLFSNNETRIKQNTTTLVSRALKFDGVDDYVNAGNNPSLNMSTGNVTVGLWFKTGHKDGVNYQTMISKKGGSSADAGYCIGFYNDSGDFGVYFNVGDGIQGEQATYYTPSYDMVDNNWHYVAGVWEYGKSVKIYIDGVLKGTDSSISLSGSLNSALNLEIGHVSSGIEWFNGTIDEVRIYNRALNQSEISDYYNAGLGKYGQTESGLIGLWHFDNEANDYSGYNNHGKIYGATFVEGKVIPPNNDAKITYELQFCPGTYGITFDVANRVKTSISGTFVDDSFVKITPAVIEIWNYTTGDIIESSPATGLNLNGDGFIDVVIGSHDHNVYAFSGNNGTKLWSFKTQGVIYSSPFMADIITGDNRPEVVIGSYDGKLYLLNGTNGSQIWNSTAGGNIGSSPTVIDLNGDSIKDIVIGSTNGKIWAVRGNNGTQLWNFSTSGVVWASPVAANLTAGGTVYVFVGSQDGYFYALNGTNGSQIWNYPVGSMIESSAAVDISTKIVVFGAYDGKLYALNASTGTNLWKYTTPTAIISSPVIADTNNDTYNDVVFAAGGKVYDRNLSNGAHIWNYTIPTGGGSDSSPAIADINNDTYNDVVFGASDNYVYALNGLDGSFVWKYNIGGSVWGSPAIYDVNGDGTFEVIVGSNSKTINIIDPPGSSSSSSATMWRGDSSLRPGSSDDDPPYNESFQISDTMIYPSDSIEIDSKWRDMGNLAYAVIEENSLGGWNTHEIRLNGVTSWVNYSFSGSALKNGQYVNYKITVADTFGNENSISGYFIPILRIKELGEIQNQTQAIPSELLRNWTLWSFAALIVLITVVLFVVIIRTI